MWCSLHILWYDNLKSSKSTDVIFNPSVISDLKCHTQDKPFTSVYEKIQQYMHNGTAETATLDSE